MEYATLKLVHQAMVTVSFAGFFARGLAALRGAGWVRSRPARTLPHVVDSVLLASALMMVWLLRANPAATPWLAAKIGGLLLYIGLGMVALRPGLPRAWRAAAWVSALFVFAWIAAVALSKNPWIGLRGLPAP